MRLIDADALLKILEQDAADNDEWNTVRADGVRDAIMCVHEAPTLEEWHTDHGYIWLCPECGLSVHSDDDGCPRCGHKKDDTWRKISI